MQKNMQKTYLSLMQSKNIHIDLCTLNCIKDVRLKIDKKRNKKRNYKDFKVIMS